MGLRILNGRFFGDSLGQFTSYQNNGSSVINYFIVSESLLDNISFFKVHKCNGLMSDHCNISMMFNINCFIHVSNPKLHIFPDRYKWGTESDTNFRTVLESNNTKKSITEVEKLISDTKSPTENYIENLVNNFNRIVYDAADQSLKKKNGTGKRKINNKNKKCRSNNHQKWYDSSLITFKSNLDDRLSLLLKYERSPSQISIF